MTQQPATPVSIRWQEGTPPAERRALEGRYLLANGERRGPVNWVYDLLDTSGGNIEAFVANTAVADTHGVNRATFEPSGELSDVATTSALARVPWLRHPAHQSDAALALLLLALPWAAVLLWRTVPRQLLALGGALRGRRWQQPITDASTGAIVGAVAAVVAVTAVVRFLTLEMKLSGDDHFGLWIAGAVLRGAVPNVDIFDAGGPMPWWLSLAGQWLSGYRLIGEVAMAILFESVAVALAFVLTWRASRSPFIAAAVVPLSLILLLATKLYVYPKLFLYPLVLAVAWRYLARPNRWRLLEMAFVIALAFLFRHDHGVYATVGVTAAIVLSTGFSRFGDMARSLATVAGLVVLLLSPWLAWIAATEGLLAYGTSRIQLSSAAGIAVARPPLGLTVTGAQPWVALPAPEPASIEVTWTGLGTGFTGVLTDADRIAREQRYGLGPAGAGAEGSLRYDLRDTSLANVSALVADPAVDVLTGLDPLSSTPVAEADLMGRWRRQLPPLRLQVLSGVLHRENAPRWLFTLFVCLPLATLLILGLDARRGRPERFPGERPAMITAAILLAAAEAGLMRKLGYFSDLTTLGIVLGGWLLSTVWAPRLPPTGARHTARLPEGLQLFATVSVLIVTLIAAGVFVKLSTYFEAYTENNSAAQATGTLSRRVSDLMAAYMTAPPVDTYAPPGIGDDRILIRYFYECTAPGDAIWELGGNFAWPYYAERTVVQHPFWFIGFKSTPADQARTLAWVAAHPVPLIFAKDGTRPLQWLEGYSEVHRYAEGRFQDVTTPAVKQLYANDNNRGVWILADRTLTPTRTFEPLGLPCFR